MLGPASLSLSLCNKAASREVPLASVNLVKWKGEEGCAPCPQPQGLDGSWGGARHAPSPALSYTWAPSSPTVHCHMPLTIPPQQVSVDQAPGGASHF